ncbi:hypothetical protein RUM43_013326, partial [Polyplax serrata]
NFSKRFGQTNETRVQEGIFLSKKKSEERIPAHTVMVSYIIDEYPVGQKLDLFSASKELLVIQLEWTNVS